MLADQSGFARIPALSSLRVRAAVSLARWWAGQGKCAGAQELLAPVHAWFTEGFDIPDVVEARALLDALALRSVH